jgi:predicted RNA-binding Zn-ribbon protein involved in translation (DUF1610 family)
MTLEQLPINVIMHCPECGSRHIDAGVWASKPHHTHACQHCGFVWRPMIENSYGVLFLPGFKNDEDDDDDRETAVH